MGYCLAQAGVWEKKGRRQSQSERKTKVKLKDGGDHRERQELRKTVSAKAKHSGKEDWTEAPEQPRL